jgi:glutamine amidotransferase
MCRILAVKSAQPFDTKPHLRAFAQLSRNSKEFQGHGWGCAVQGDDGAWKLYRNIKPIWDDDLSVFGESRYLIAHARSAFRDEGVTVENNMPFCDGPNVFVFNGELHGVRIRETGRIGAEKVFNYIKRFDKGDTGGAMRRAFGVIEKRSENVRAMNVVIGNADRAYVGTLFNDDPEYYTMQVRFDDDGFAVCSEAYDLFDDWQPLANRSFKVLT